MPARCAVLATVLVGRRDAKSRRGMARAAECQTYQVVFGFRGSIGVLRFLVFMILGCLGSGRWQLDSWFSLPRRTSGCGRTKIDRSCGPERLACRVVKRGGWLGEGKIKLWLSCSGIKMRSVVLRKISKSK